MSILDKIDWEEVQAKCNTYAMEHKEVPWSVEEMSHLVYSGTLYYYMYSQDDFEQVPLTEEELDSILDEFGQTPPTPEFELKLTACWVLAFAAVGRVDAIQGLALVARDGL